MENTIVACKPLTSTSLPPFNESECYPTMLRSWTCLVRRVQLQYSQWWHVVLMEERSPKVTGLRLTNISCCSINKVIATDAGRSFLVNEATNL